MTRHLFGVLSVLLLTGCVYEQEEVRIVNASGERLASVEVSVSGRKWHLRDIDLGEVRRLPYRAGWFEPTYEVQVEYELGGEYGISHTDSALDSATLIIGKNGHDLSYSGQTTPGYEEWIRNIENARPYLARRRQRVTGLAEGETTLSTLRRGTAIQLLEVEYGGMAGLATETFYVGPDKTLLAVRRRVKSQEAHTGAIETYYFDPGGAMRFYVAARPPQDPQDRVEIDAAYLLQYFERLLQVAEQPDDSVQIPWINRE